MAVLKVDAGDFVVVESFTPTLATITALLVNPWKFVADAAQREQTELFPYINPPVGTTAPAPRPFTIQFTFTESQETDWIAMVVMGTEHLMVEVPVAQWHQSAPSSAENAFAEYLKLIPKRPIAVKRLVKGRNLAFTHFEPTRWSDADLDSAKAPDQNTGWNIFHVLENTARFLVDPGALPEFLHRQGPAAVEVHDHDGENKATAVPGERVAFRLPTAAEGFTFTFQTLPYDLQKHLLANPYRTLVATGFEGAADTVCYKIAGTYQKSGPNGITTVTFNQATQFLWNGNQYVIIPQ